MSVVPCMHTGDTTRPVAAWQGPCARCVCMDERQPGLGCRGACSSSLPSHLTRPLRVLHIVVAPRGSKRKDQNPPPWACCSADLATPKMVPWKKHVLTSCTWPVSPPLKVKSQRFHFGPSERESALEHVAQVWGSTEKLLDTRPTC